MNPANATLPASKPKNIWLPWLPFAALFAVMLAFHLQLELVGGDEVYYAGIIDGMGLWTFSVSHYFTWTSRTLVELVVCVLAWLPWLVWRLLDPLVVTAAAVCLARLAGVRRDAKLCWMLCGLVLAYPWQLMATAGWITTTLVYLWPTAAGLAALLPVASWMRGQPPPRWLCVLSLPLALYAANMEQVAVCLFIALAAAAGWLLVARRRVHWVIWANLAMVLLNLAWALASPGAAARAGGEATSWFQNFGMLGFVDKFGLGLAAALNPLVYGRDYLFDLFCLLLAAAVWLRNPSWPRRIVGLLPLAVSLLFGYTMRLFPALAFFTEAIGQEGIVTAANFRSPAAWVPLWLLLAVFALCAVGLYLAFGHSGAAFAAITALLCGLMSKAAIGFSPTVWSSGARTGFMFAVALIGLSAALLRAIRPGPKWWFWGAALLVAAAALLQTVSLFAT